MNEFSFDDSLVGGESVDYRFNMTILAPSPGKNYFSEGN